MLMHYIVSNILWWSTNICNNSNELSQYLVCISAFKKLIELTRWRSFETTILDDVMTIAGMRDPLSYPSEWNASVISTWLHAATARGENLHLGAIQKYNPQNSSSNF